MFLIDGSFSIGPFTFSHEVLRFVSEFVTLFKIAGNETRVSVIQYSHFVRNEIKFDRYFDLNALQDAIRRIEYLKGMTRTG